MPQHSSPLHAYESTFPQSPTAVTCDRPQLLPERLARASEISDIDATAGPGHCGDNKPVTSRNWHHHPCLFWIRSRKPAYTTGYCSIGKHADVVHAPEHERCGNTISDHTGCSCLAAAPVQRSKKSLRRGYGPPPGPPVVAASRWGSLRWLQIARAYFAHFIIFDCRVLVKPYSYVPSMQLTLPHDTEGCMHRRE